MMGKTMDTEGTVLMTHRMARHRSSISVKMWTRLIGTCRRYVVSGWYLAGLKNSRIRSMNWMNKIPENQNSSVAQIAMISL